RLQLNRDLSILGDGATTFAPDVRLHGGAVFPYPTWTIGGAQVTVNGTLSAEGDNAAPVAGNLVWTITSSTGQLHLAGDVVPKFSNSGNNKTLCFNGNADIMISGVIRTSGSGSGKAALATHGGFSGLLHLSASNTYERGTVHRSGLIELANDHALGSGVLTMSGPDSTNFPRLAAAGGSRTIPNDLGFGPSAGIAGNHALTFTGSGSLAGSGFDFEGVHGRMLILSNAAPCTFLRPFSMGGDNSGNERRFNIDTRLNTAVVRFEGGIPQPNPTWYRTLKKHGPGTVILEGTNSYHGETFIARGTVRLNGVLASNEFAVVIQSNGSFAGTGTVVRPVQVNSHGIIAPGDDVGAMTIRSNLRVRVGAIYAWEIGATTNDLLDVSSSEVTFDGSWTLALGDAGGSPTPNRLYTLLNYGSLSGFDPTHVTIDASGLPGFSGATVSNDVPNQRLVLRSGNIDTDGDRMSDDDEIIAGTDPMDPDSFLWIRIAQSGSPTNSDLSFQSYSNRTYHIQRSTNLFTGPWLNVRTGLAGDGLLQIIRTSNTVNRLYYRIGVTMP
ncbi:MAG: autotransporter-associated beta strand repeat-containing protein, partial [Verrucomicrobiota bacterium]